MQSEGLRGSKLLATVRGRSVLAWLLSLVQDLGWPVTVLADYDAELVHREATRLGARCIINPETSPQEKILDAASRLRARSMLVLSGDTLLDPRVLVELYRTHKTLASRSTLGVAIQSQPTDSQWLVSRQDHGVRILPSLSPSRYERTGWIVSRDALPIVGSTLQSRGLPDSPGSDDLCGFEVGSVNSLIASISVRVRTELLESDCPVVNINHRSDLPRAAKLLHELTVRNIAQSN